MENRTNEPKVSIIVPVFNEERHLLSCLNSLLKQTITDIEVLCINDGSTDNSLQILDDLKAKDSRIKIFEQDHSGAGNARNLGIQVASGQFIAFVDADDYYYDNKALEHLYNAAMENSVDICGGGFCELRNKKLFFDFNKAHNGYIFDKNEFVEFNNFQFDYGFQRFLFKTDFLINNNLLFPTYLRYQDPPFLAKALFKATQFYAITDIIYVFRFNEFKNIWIPSKIRDLLKGISDNLRLAKENNLSELYYRNYARLNVDFCEVIKSNINRENKDILLMLLDIENSLDRDILQSSVLNRDADIGLKALDDTAFGGDLAKVKQSFSYRLGCALTKVPRAIKRRR